MRQICRGYQSVRRPVRDEVRRPFAQPPPRFVPREVSISWRRGGTGSRGDGGPATEEHRGGNGRSRRRGNEGRHTEN
ncbi:unnamed protein product [Acanthoscelides obtectus]|uniref:Uncharacterized protein n=1 Tax=Acanthoscelides obtectus TaxID=200917 RepID=A0A9P0LDX1_ACAOB|nr:unnamed protein product [Acanthoscelides obtectus]CAK1630529.1 hypothetical protein AOBTE_LOCUS6386 [Acanthoscelides obtectus]